MIRILLVLALVAYLARALAPWLPRLKAQLEGVGVLGLGMALHAAGLAGELLLEGWQQTLHLILEGLSLTIMLGHLYLRRRPRMEALETVLLPLAALLLLLGLLAPGQAVGGVSPSWWLPVHIGFMLIGFAGLAVAFSLSILYLWVRDRLRRKKLEGIGRLPSLATLDALNHRSMILGFIALTAGAASGALSAHSRGEISGADVTIYATAAVWLWYAIGLHLRLVAGYRGQWAAWFGVLGFAGVSAIMATATLVLRSWHGGGM